MAKQPSGRAVRARRRRARQRAAEQGQSRPTRKGVRTTGNRKKQARQRDWQKGATPDQLARKNQQLARDRERVAADQAAAIDLVELMDYCRTNEELLTLYKGMRCKRTWTYAPTADTHGPPVPLRVQQASLEPLLLFCAESALRVGVTTTGDDGSLFSDNTKTVYEDGDVGKMLGECLHGRHVCICGIVGGLGTAAPLHGVIGEETAHIRKCCALLPEGTKWYRRRLENTILPDGEMAVPMRLRREFPLAIPFEPFDPHWTLHATIGRTAFTIIVVEPSAGGATTERVLAQFRKARGRPASAAATDPSTCVVCMDRPTACAMVPCGHRSYCRDCVEQLTECAICRVPKEGALRVFG